MGIERDCDPGEAFEQIDEKFKAGCRRMAKWHREYAGCVDGEPRVRHDSAADVYSHLAVHGISSVDP